MDARIKCSNTFYFYEVESGLCEPCKTICYLAKEKGLLSLCENLCGDYFKTYGISALPGESPEDDADSTKHIANRLDRIERFEWTGLGIQIVLALVIGIAFIAHCWRKCKKIKLKNRRSPQFRTEGTRPPTYGQSANTNPAPDTQSADERRSLIDGTENEDIHVDEPSDSQSINNTRPLINGTENEDIHVDEPSDSQSVNNTRPLIDGTENKNIHVDEPSDSQSTNNTSPLIDGTNDMDIHLDEPTEMNDIFQTCSQSNTSSEEESLL